VGLVLLAFVVASCTRGRTGIGASASPSSTESTAEPSSAPPSPTVRELVSVSAGQLVSRSFGVAAISDCRVNGDEMLCQDHLAATQDLGRTWSDITPFDTVPSERYAGLEIEHVFFLDPEHGWVVAGDCAAARAVLFRTSDGGRSWHHAPTETSTCNAGAGVVPQFVGPTHGWLIHLEPTVSSASIRRTVDGGRTWSRGGDFESITGVRFLDRRTGWLGGFLHHRAGLFRTANGGRTWARVPAPLPACCREWKVLVDRPTFSDAEHAVVPITLRHGTRSVVAFDVTADGGRTWGLASVLRPSGRSGPKGFPSPVPASIATATAWWVVVGDPPILYRTDDGGSTWRIFPIGAGGHVTSIAAVDGDRAWLTSYRGPAGTLFVTMNGGRSWGTASPVA